MQDQAEKTSHRRNKRDGALASVVPARKPTPAAGPSLGEVRGTVRMTDEQALQKALSGEAMVQKKLAPKRVRAMMRSDVFMSSVRTITAEFDRMAINNPRASDQVLQGLLRKRSPVAKEFDRMAGELYKTVAKRNRTRQEEMTISAMFQTLVGRERGIYRTDDEADEAFRAAIIPYHLHEQGSDKAQDQGRSSDQGGASEQSQQVVEIEQDEELEAVIRQSTNRAQALKDNAKQLFHDGSKANRLAEIAAQNDELTGRRRIPRRKLVDSRKAALDKLRALRDRAEQDALAAGPRSQKVAPMIPDEGNEIQEAPALPADPQQAERVVRDAMQALAAKARVTSAQQAQNTEEEGGEERERVELQARAAEDLEARYEYVQAYGPYPFPTFLPPFPQARDIRATWLRVRHPGDLPSRSVPLPLAPVDDWDEASRDLVLGTRDRIAENLRKAQSIMSDQAFDRSRVGPDGAVRASVRTVEIKPE